MQCDHEATTKRWLQKHIKTFHPQINESGKPTIQEYFEEGESENIKTEIKAEVDTMEKLEYFEEDIKSETEVQSADVY